MHVMRETPMRAAIIFVLGLFLLVSMSVAQADDACRCKGCGCKGGAGWRGPDGVCVSKASLAKVHAGGRAVQAGVGNPCLLRQAVSALSTEAGRAAIGLATKVCLRMARSPKLPRHARPE